LTKLFDTERDGADVSANAKEAKDSEAAQRHALSNATAFEAP